jgi:hypothetical protein
MNHLELVTRAELFKSYIPHESDPTIKNSSVDHYCYGASRLDAEALTVAEKNQVVRKYLYSLKISDTDQKHFIDARV